MKVPGCCKMKTAALALMIFTICSLLPLAAAGTRRGATVEVTMADGSRVRGELLIVKNDALLVFDQDTNLGKSLDLRQVDRVKVLRRSKLSEGVSIGIGVGLLLSVRNLKKMDRESLVPVFFQKVVSFWPLPITGLGGGLLGAIGSIPKKYPLAGVAPQTFRKNLERLARFARERDGPR